MVLQSQRIDNLIDFLERVESTALNSQEQSDQNNNLVEALRQEVIEVLKIAFAEGDRTVRRSAVYGLSKIGLDKSLQFFIEALNDPDEHVRGWAAEALGRIKDQRAVNPLINALADENHYVCFNVSAALKRFPPNLIINQLLRALDNPDALIRRRVAKLLGELGDLRVTDALISTLKDEDPNVRYEAAEALRKLKNPISILPLISALHDPSPDVRTVAIMALSVFGDERAIEPLVAMMIEQKDHRHLCIEALKNICGTDNLEPLFELIRSCKKMIANTSINILEKLSEKRSEDIPERSQPWALPVDPKQIRPY